MSKFPRKYCTGYEYRNLKHVCTRRFFLEPCPRGGCMFFEDKRKLKME